MNQKITFFAVLFAAFAILIAQNFHRVNAEDAAPSPYKVVWDSPSTDWGGTMPLGNGEVAVNAWFDAAGRARLLFARTDSWDDYGALAKVGLVEIATLGETPDAEITTPFRQELDAETGRVAVVYGPQGRETRVCLWVDTARPNVVLEIESDLEIAPVATVTLLRTDGQRFGTRRRSKGRSPYGRRTRKQSVRRLLSPQYQDEILRPNRQDAGIRRPSRI